MSLVITLPADQEALLEQEAQKEGVTVNELIQRTLTERFFLAHDETARALDLIEQWLADAPTDPEKVKEAEEDLLSLQRALNNTRRQSGARPLYPDAE